MIGEFAVCKRSEPEGWLLSDSVTTGTAFYGVEPGGGLLTGSGIDPIYAEPSIIVEVHPLSGMICVKGTGEMPGWLVPALSGLQALVALPHDWDSYGAPPIDFSYVTKAIQVLVEVMEHNTPAPSVVPTSRGGIQFEWHMLGLDVEIEIEPNHLISGFCRRRGTVEEKEVPPTREVGSMKPLISALARR